MFFSGNLLNAGYWVESLIAFAAFSLMASAVYCLNDVKDAEVDKLHPTKRLRPVASGDVSILAALILSVILCLSSLAVALFGLSLKPVPATITLATYTLLNIAYCLRLKHFAIIDVFIVASGFVLRLVAGGLACDIWLSPWIVCITFLLALFLAFAKRRDDVILSEKESVVVRKNIARYNLPFLNQVLAILGAVVMVCYILYTVSPEVIERFDSEYVYATSIFVLAGILRYLQIAMVDMESGSPTKILLKDRFIQCCILCWVALFVAIIYL